MGVDKWKARHDRWRVPERAFFCVALLGGTPGPSWACGPSGTRPATGISGTACPPCCWCSSPWARGLRYVFLTSDVPEGRPSVGRGGLSRLFPSLCLVPSGSTI
ncbi:DUF1294 domain-containing protein [Flavonifractor plautii]|nr:DUF1294 domain-containing protein [Flavonifractor plautii]